MSGTENGARKRAEAMRRFPRERRYDGKVRSTKLPDWMERRLIEICERDRVNPSSVLRRALDDYLQTDDAKRREARV